MGKYSLTFRKSVAKELRALPGKDIARILRRFDQIARNPRGRGCEKLTEQERYRVRQGDYRIVYEVKDNDLVVIVVKIGHRRDVYKEL